MRVREKSMLKKRSIRRIISHRTLLQRCPQILSLMDTTETFYFIKRLALRPVTSEIPHQNLRGVDPNYTAAKKCYKETLQFFFLLFFK